MMNLHKTIQIIVPILSVFLLLSIYITTIGSIYTLRLETAAAHTELKKSHEESELIFPEWIHYLDISDTTYLTTHSQLASQIATSKKISTDILSDNQNCSATQEKSFALFTAFFTKNNEKEKLISYYETCCPEDKKITTNSVLLCK